MGSIFCFFIFWLEFLNFYQILDIENPPELIDEYDLSQENDEHLPVAEPMEHGDGDVVNQDDDAADSTVVTRVYKNDCPSACETFRAPGLSTRGPKPI